jgi:adenine deaminase
LVVVQRHKGTGRVGLGFLKGMGLKQGALASSVAHDSHNIIAAGVDDEDLLLAIREIGKLQGGLIISNRGKVIEALPLPIAGLLSEWSLKKTVKTLTSLNQRAFELGCILAEPFSTLSFLALPVIPELKLTDLGLVDVSLFQHVSLFVD